MSRLINPQTLKEHEESVNKYFSDKKAILDKIKVPNTGEASIIHNSLINLTNKKEIKENKDNILINFKILNETINYNYYELEALKNYTGTKFIDRTMVNFFFYEIIFKIFPNTKIIHCNRNYFHNLIAIYKQCLENLKKII